VWKCILVFVLFASLAWMCIFMMPCEVGATSLHCVIMEECRKQGLDERQCLARYEPELLSHITTNVQTLQAPCQYSAEYYPVHKPLCEAVCARVEEWGY